MGSGSSKVYTNRTPPSPNNHNFPVQSNPKFQSQGNQHQNEWPYQNNTQYNQQFSNNYPSPSNNSSFPVNSVNQNPRFAQNRVPQLNKMDHNPNAMPLTPTEIEEYRRQGLQFPPYNQSRIPQGAYRVPCGMRDDEENEEYTVTAEEVNFVRNIYDQNCGPDGRMDFQQFQNMYQHDFETSRRAFAIMDRDMDGLINFDDFLLGYCRTKPQPEKREYLRPEARPVKRIDQHLPFGPLDEYDPYTTPIENIATSLKPFVY